MIQPLLLPESLPLKALKEQRDASEIVDQKRE